MLMEPPKGAAGAEWYAPALQPDRSAAPQRELLLPR